MKSTRNKLAVSALALVVSATPVLGCQTVPKANTSKSQSVVIATATVSQERQSDTPAKTGAKQASETKTESKTETKQTPVVKPETKPVPTPAVKPETKPAPTPAVKPETKPGACPQGKACEQQTHQAEAFTINNFKIIQQALEKLGVSPSELEGMIKEGKKLIDVLETKDISVSKFRKVLYKEYCMAITEGVKEGKLTKEEGKYLKAALKQKVMSWMKDTK